MARLRVRVSVWYLAALVVGGPAAAWAQGPPAPSPDAGSGTPQSSPPTPSRALVFDMGEIVIIGSPTEQQINRPTHPTLSSTEPVQEQSQNTWSITLEDTVHATPTVDIVGGVSYDKYHITKAEEFNATRGIFEYPKGGSDAFNWQSAVVWRYNRAGQIHASVSDRARFPVIFELYSDVRDLIQTYELAWGFPQPGRTFYFKTRLGL